MSTDDTPTVYRVPATVAVVIEADRAVVVLRPLTDHELTIEAVLTETEARDLARTLHGTAGYLADAPDRRRAVSR